MGGKRTASPGADTGAGGAAGDAGTSSLSEPRATVTPMLAELRIAHLGVIDDALIEPASGFTVVTGETGAGKTMVVTALGLVCGGRADSGRVRSGAKKSVVEARFAPDRAAVHGAVADGAASGRVATDDATHAAGASAQDQARYLADAAERVGGDVDDDESLLAVRSVSADGRSRAHIGGRSVPVAALAELTEPLVTVHGQAEAMSLLRPAYQRTVLDRYAGLQTEVDAYRELREQWMAARADIDDRLLRAREMAQREQLLRVGLEEVDRADPQPGEDRDVAAEVRRLDDADALRAAAQGAMTALTGTDDLAAAGDEPSAAELVQQAIRLLESASDPDLGARLTDLRGALAVLGDVGADLGRYIGDLNADPARLEALLERQATLRGLVRKYGEDIDAVRQWAEDARRELDGLDNSDEALAALRERAAALAEQVSAAARALSERRKEAAATLSAAATAELAHLAMGNASLRIAVTARSVAEGSPEALALDGGWVAAGPDGVDQVELLVTPHPAAPELPVARGASGGELSRIMLALEVVLAGADPVATLVFDEVDAGVGGRAATEIGRRLAMLAEDHQVIVVTHLAQVAAFADRHYVVDADADGSVGASAVRSVDGESRLAELARMLGGTDGEVAQAHAENLVTAAAEHKTGG